MIYFLQPTEGGPVKIGFSRDVDARRSQLEAHYGKPLALLATMPGGRDEERAIHERFAHLRLGRTEQFRPAPELMAFIGRPLFVNQGDIALMEPDLTTIRLKVSAEWADWLERGARHCRTDIAKLIDAAVTRYAVVHGFTKPPPERIP